MLDLQFANLFLTKKFSQFQMNTYQAWIILSLQSNCFGLDWALAQPSLLIRVLLLTVLHLGFSAFVDCAPSWIFRLAENLASFGFQYGAIKWYQLINSVVSIAQLVSPSVALLAKLFFHSFGKCSIEMVKFSKIYLEDLWLDFTNIIK